MGRKGITTLLVLVLFGLLGPVTPSVAENMWPHTVVNGFSTASGNGYWLLYADGTVATAVTPGSTATPRAWR